MENKKVKIGLCLSSGALLGISHLGFLQELCKNGIIPDMISGCSMGSVIGGLFCSGTSIDTLIDGLLSLKKNDIVDLNFFNMLSTGALKGEKVESLIYKYASCKKFDDCPIKFFCATTNLTTGKSVIVEKGCLARAIRASAAIPGIFAPVKNGKSFFVDGGVTNALPFEVLKKSGADIVIAVNCINDYYFDEKSMNVFNIISNSMGIMQGQMIENQMKKYGEMCDFYVRDNFDNVDSLQINVDLIPDLLENGRQKAREIIPEIRKTILKLQNKQDTNESDETFDAENIDA